MMIIMIIINIVMTDVTMKKFMLCRLMFFGLNFVLSLKLIIF